MQTSVKQLVEESAEALRADDAAMAQEKANQALQTDPNSPMAHMLLGISHAQLGNDEEATIELRRAAMLAPKDVVILTNLAVHLHDTGSHTEATEFATEAAKVDPKFAPTQKLLEMIKEGGKESAFLLPKESIPAKDQNEGPEDRAPHRLGLGSETWTNIGWGLLMAGAFAGVYRIAASPFHVDPGSKTPLSLAPGPLPLVWIYLLIVSAFGTLLWTMMDCFDRKRSIIWVAPLLAFSFCGLHVLPAAIYMFLRKKS